MTSAISYTCLETLPWLESSNANETGQGSHEGVIIAHNASTNNIIGKQTSVPKRHRRHGSRRLARSESNGAYCRRPSLSLISPKKALLNIQDRQVFKPHAKAHRLPGTKATATSTPTLAIAATSVYSTKLSNARCNSETTDNDLLILCSDTPNVAPRLESQAVVTNSVGEEGIVETTQEESNTSEDTIQSREQCHGLDETMDADISNEPDTDNCVLTTDHQDQTPIGPVQCITKVEFGSALSSALETLSIGPRSELDAKETKRFVKRSHALKELETTEESYVNDLDVLLHSRDNYLYSAFCELRMRTVNEINKSAGQATMTLLQRECKDLMLQQGRPSSRSDLKDFLIKPIQRICRYPLLLEEILRLTNENDPEYQYIEQAYQFMKGKAQEMDENQRMVERRLLTEQFLKKLPDTSFPRKMGLISSKEQSTSSDMNLGNNTNINSSIHAYQTTTDSIRHDGNRGGLMFNSDLASDSCFDFGSGLEGFNPAALTKAFAGTLGSIILAGALEYVITPDMPVRLKYYGCILFETMLIVVKVKKSNLYEPRQWLPLRFCELHETTKLDGYTQFGWRIVFDQFRIDFGANSVTEQQVWINTLQGRIWTAKEAYIRLPREITTFETVVSSLPWKANSSFAAGYMNARQQQISHKSPLFSPSHWSSCSSAIPSPLMPPPPSVSSSTMMMAISSVVTIEPEKWNSQGYGQTLDSHAYRQDLCSPGHQLGSNFSEKVRESSVRNHEGMRIGGMTSNWNSGKEVSDQNQRFLSPLNAHDYRTRSEPQLLNSSTQVPRFLYGNRPKNNSFDVARAFTSSNNSIKPNQRMFVQSLFKDVSTEHIWTSSAAVQPSSQSASVLSRNNSSNSLSDSLPIATPSSPQMNASGAFSVPSAWDSSGSVTLLGEDSYASVHVTGSPSSSLTSQVLRRRGSGMGVQPLPSGAAGNLDKSDWGQQRNSATSIITETLSLNFQKNSDPQQHRHRRYSSSIVETGMYGPESQEGAVSSGDGCGTPAILTQKSYSLLSSVRPTEDCGDDHFEGPPFEAGKEVLDTLKNVGEAARSRRGNSDRVLKNSALRSPSSSHSLPARLRLTNSSALSLLASPSIEAPKENAERIWPAMGRIIPKRVGGNVYEKNSRSRANSNSSNSSNHTNPPMDHVGDSISSIGSFHNQRQLHRQQPNAGDSQEHALHEEVLIQNEQPSPMNATNVGRTSTRDSGSTVTSHNSSLGYSDDTRTGSIDSSHSMDSNMCLDGGEATLTSSAPPRPALTTFVSASNCSTKTRSQDLRSLFAQDNGQPANTTEYRPPLPMTSSDRNSKVVSKPRPVYQPQGQRRPDSLPSTSSQDRRKSLSIFQSITNSASQKFRSLIRSQNGPKRRTVMGLSPMTMECSSSLDDLVAKKATEEKDKGCENETMV
ncbi:hypothetical protein BGX20_000031 [Mortierella sp. AD010]|nr:hypothetical protein BGX20_000031 [Mortierella sp. AD010]